jgi:hypothetical protein
MGAVASFVSDVVESVGDVAEGVFDAVGDVVETVGDVVETVVEKVGDTVQAVLDDPIPVLLSVAGSMVGIPPAVTMGAITAARGGDLEDIALAAGTAYFAPQVGNAISSTVSSSFIEAGFNETFSQVASDSISKGLVNGTVAEIKGGSFDDGFAGGFTGGMVSGGVSEVASYVKPDVIQLAQESGLDLKDATAVYNAGTRAFSAGVTSEVTGRGDFATSFTNSAVGSGIDYGARSLNQTIDEQFRTAATDWNEKDKEGEPIDVATVGAGIPNSVVSEVQLSDIGVDNDAGTFDTASVLADSQEARDVNNASSSYTGERAVSDISVLPDTELAQAPQGETIDNFSELADIEQMFEQKPNLLQATNEVPQSVVDIAQEIPEENISAAEPQGALASMSAPAMSEAPPAIDLSTIGDEVPTTTAPPVIAEAPVSNELLTQGLKPTETPVGGLNAMAEKTPDQKMAEAQGLKVTDFTKPLVATVGNILKSTLRQGTKPAPRPAQRPVQRPAPRPAGGLQAVKATRTPPPQQMDVSKLIPIQRAEPIKTAQLPPSAPPKRLDKNAKLTPVENIAGLTSQVKKTG